MLFYFYYSRRKFAKRLQQKRHTLHQHTARAHAILEAEDKERKRIGLELHDGLGQLISIAKLNLTGLQEEVHFTDETHKKLLRNTLSVLDEAFKEVRSISHNLAAGALQQQSLPAALRHLLDSISQTDRYEVHLETVGFLEEKLPYMVEKVIYRVVQESLNNILKHAHANIISVQLIRHEQELTLMIEDNGTGFDQFNLPETEGIGLKNIRSRIEYLNGTFHIDSVFKRGTILTVEIPLAATHPQRKQINERPVAQHKVAVS
jgi:signal transduction histidine kinase